MDMEKWALSNQVHKIIAGSRLFGTDTPLSDFDYRGVCLMPPSVLLGLGKFDQFTAEPPDDTVIYGLTKFFRLALDCNPNILDILFAPPETWMVHSTCWDTVYKNRHRFLHQRVRYSYSQYAVSQLKRIKGHKAWLLNPPEHKPTLKEWNGFLLAEEGGGQAKVFAHPDLEDGYNKAMRTWKQYQTWLKNRNPVRAKLEAEFGYDTKHAGHLVRLMLQGESLLKHGDFNPRLDGTASARVNDVMQGKWRYNKLVSWAEGYDRHLKEMSTDLPKKRQYREVDQLLQQLNYLSLKAT